MPDEDFTIILCLLPNLGTEALKAYLERAIPKPGCFKIGKVVFSLSGIKDSYESCLENNSGAASSGGGDGEKSIPSKKTNHSREPLKEQMLRYVEDHFNNSQLSQISVADHFGMSIYMVSRFFKNEIGVGFSEFITAKRMEYARNLLVSTGKDIIEIAATAGFLNVNYFSRLFKSYYGEIPSKYRIKQN
jgi:AraC-like DNA-binding protein